MKPKAPKKTKEENTDNKKSEPNLTEAELLAKQNEELSREKDELFEKLQRISADYANYQKRTPKQIADSVAYEKKSDN